MSHIGPSCGISATSSEGMPSDLIREWTPARVNPEPRSDSIGTEMALVLERVELVLARHGDSERAQSVLHPDRTPVLGQPLRQRATGPRAFTGGGACQRNARRLQPGVHLGPREPPLGLLATEQG